MQSHYHKLPDMPAFLVKKQREAGKVVFKHPYDCFTLHFGMFIAMELKQPNALSLRTQSPTSSGLTPEQEDALTAVERHGGCGLVVVNFLMALSKEQVKKRGIEVLDVTWSTTMSQLAAARRQVGKDAIPLEWFERNGTEVPKHKLEGKLAWDPRPMLTMAREWRMATPWGA